VSHPFLNIRRSLAPGVFSHIVYRMTKTEVIGLIDASFADNANSRKLKKEIMESEVAAN
jgi:hypothetical protein